MKSKGNLWRVSTTVSQVAQPLPEDKSVDLVVIGGGFTGNSAALEAARRGASVAVLEARTVGHGGSGRNVGLVNAGLWIPPQEVIGIMGNAAGHKLMAALAEGPSRVWRIIEDAGIDCEATRNGTLHLAHSAAGVRNLQERHRQGAAMGWPVECLDAKETARRTGSLAFYGSLFDPRAGTIQPLSYARGLAAAAHEAGARLHDQTKVTRIRQLGDKWIIEANGFTVRARALLLATNAYFDGIEMGFRPEFVAVSYFQFATAPMPARLRESILPGGEGCWDTAVVMSSFRIDEAGRMIVGAVGDLDGPGRPIHAAWARRALSRVYPQLADLPFEHDWCGRIAMTADHIPKIVALGPNAYASFGYSGRGISPGTVFGTQAAIALLEADESVLPVAPVRTHRERLVRAKEVYYESGAVLTHALRPALF
ncbi:NAD(P)/FAD-dependent oxidoreductase [Paracoccus aerius]|uniref:FAD-binding oxidoreductase n=1 Tax=Paracoccus aerius TaxID=1915382 RepID=A0ABS1SCE3_9RHOB|nr:FAD-dependent oxidoreductase [Paracoccus aerius]MBL3675337.1 FAD-binding oxidoreductase [Paracoccus aerius]GHG32665.1 oxidoreductase [Paracoccus aerius]